MKKTKERLLLDKRMESASSKLWKLAKIKIDKNKRFLVCGVVGGKLGLTAQGVINYINGKGGNGYMTESLITEFEKLPTINN